MSVATLPESNVYYTQLSLSRYVRDNAFKVSNETPDLIVRLPLPTELRDDTTVSYTNVNLETVGDMFINPDRAINAAVTRNIGQLASAGLSATGRAFGTMLDRGGIMSQATSAMAGGLINSVQALLPPEQINSAVQQKNGIAPNPNPSVQFQGPVLRDFTFTWAFYPKNKEESATIDKLIRQLKARALPSENGNNGTTILNYPHICQLNFYPWDGRGTPESHGWTDQSIIKIKKCFMSGVNANYNAFGTPGFFEGTQLPISYQLTISFKEIEYLLASDWDKDENVASLRANTTFEAASAVAQTGELVLKTGFGVIQETLRIGGDLIAGDYTTSTADEVQNDDNAKEAITALENNKSESTVTWSVTDPWYVRLFTGQTGPTTYTMRRVDNKFVVTIQEPPRATETGAVTPEPTTKTFDTEAQARDYLRTENVLRDGVQDPPPRAAAAEAPE